MLMVAIVATDDGSRRRSGRVNLLSDFNFKIRPAQRRILVERFAP